MKELKILIADDEQSARELILHYLNQSSNSFIVSEAADGKAALDLLVKEKPDILFLDIKMPELDGIGVLQQRETALLPAIIFTTAFDEYALPAFDFEATDYLLKPFGKERFDKALEKATRYISFVKNPVDRTWLEQISVKQGVRTQLIPVTDIQYFHSEAAYVEVHAVNGISLINTPLYELEARLNPDRFARIHKSLIIGLPFIKAIQSLPNGDFIVLMNSGKELRGSRTYRNKLKKIFPF